MLALRRLRFGLTLGLFFFHCLASAKVEVREDSAAAKHPDVRRIEKALSKEILKTNSKNTMVPTNAWSTQAPEPQNTAPKRRVSRKTKSKKSASIVTAAPVPVTAPASSPTPAQVMAPADSNTNASLPTAMSPSFMNNPTKPESLPGDVFGIRLVRVSPKVEKPEETQAKKVAPKEYKILLVKASPDLNRRKIPRVSRRAASR